MNKLIKNKENTDESITESYISNYFKNKKLIKKISKNPEVRKREVNQIIKLLKDVYKELNSESDIQKEKKDSDVSSLFHSVCTFDFQDGCTISIGICFDESELTPASALHDEENGDLVIIYPSFFKQKKDTQIFVLLHEIGHIRLYHTNVNTQYKNIKGEVDYQNHYYKLMSKGKTPYCELNADLYAILNGAKFYTILDLFEKRDFSKNKEYDLRFTNEDISNRYLHTLKSYMKLNPYNTACSAVHEMVYENSKTDCLSSKEKRHLYQIIYEMCIVKPAKDSEFMKENVINFEYEDAIELSYNQLIMENSDDSYNEDMVYDNLDDVSKYKNQFLKIMKKYLNNLYLKTILTGSQEYNSKYYTSLIEKII